MSSNDTIVACATAAGYSSIAVLRISGSQTREFVDRLFISKNTDSGFLPNHAYYGSIVDPSIDEIIDRVLVTFFKNPYSYTGEDAAEISCHGNPVIIDRIISLLIGIGCRVAQRGEFTKRALLNGKIDLIQAEAILDTVHATCDEARRLAISKYEGKLSQKIYEIRSEVVDLLSLVEANIDFPEEEDVLNISAKTHTQTIDKISAIIEMVDILLDSADIGRKIKEGYKVLIIGRSNVGKSTLFNGIIGYDRAITHEDPGTTRDYIDDRIELQGLYIWLYDTAGFLNKTTGPDVMAQERSLSLLNQTDLVLLVFDGSEPLNEQDLSLYNLTKDKTRILVVNKIDKNMKLSESTILSDSIKVSAKTGENLDILKDNINKNLIKIPLKNQIILTRQRHVDALSQVKKYLKKGMNTSLPELLAFELHSALDIIGELTGKVLRKDILEKIFNEFCIGK
ncbi:MAG: tRNA uridine-5-carboxymethylaminomethyl(34) synthesis GTPase MnmE [bacterium]